MFWHKETILLRLANYGFLMALPYDKTKWIVDFDSQKARRVSKIRKGGKNNVKKDRLIAIGAECAPAGELEIRICFITYY